MKIVIALFSIFFLASLKTADEPKYKIEHSQKEWEAWQGTLGQGDQALSDALQYVSSSNLPLQEAKKLSNEIGLAKQIIDSCYKEINSRIIPQFPKH